MGSFLRFVIKESQRFWSDEHGVGVVEFAVLAGVFALFILLVVPLIKL